MERDVNQKLVDRLPVSFGCACLSWYAATDEVLFLSFALIHRDWSDGNGVY